MKMNIEKTRAIVYFKDGSKLESEWYLSDIYARQFAEQYLDDDNFNGYNFESRMFYEDFDIESKDEVPPLHPFNQFNPLTKIAGGKEDVKNK